MAETSGGARRSCALDTMPAEDRRAIEESNSVRSLLIIRFYGGAVGLLLPVALIAVDFATSGEYCVRVRDSLSVYYHSGARDIFVIGLGIVGFLLFSYKLNRRSEANALSTVAGVAAIAVAAFPTGLPGPVPAGECGAGASPPAATPLQVAFGIDRTAAVHVIAALVVFVMFVLMCVTTALHDRRNPFLRPAVAPVGSGGLRRLLAQLSNRAGWRFHFGCALTIVVVSGLCLLAARAGATLPLHLGPLWVAEVVGILAFSASWFVKGLDDMFFRREPWSQRDLSDIRMGVAQGEALTLLPCGDDGVPAGGAARELRYTV
ncbi:DUF998 domain-containing protein [Tsukamurella paurometabola]|uniref:DUF998 domain-containing protein n=1 Tax=Tsukamurella paurometabola TaxID=2061 RepID=A0A3P8KIK5_TSUPA|nr:DUF998 domain-containing protein [Tsukamurella paurometabola]UEA83073.1 DUF998 domain-containing protein [Tsukamurella paurometabola]VDR40158.1 Uncharacterised protein [Tsukamurella paurometabola]